MSCDFAWGDREQLFRRIADMDQRLKKVEETVAANAAALEMIDNSLQMLLTLVTPVLAKKEA